MMSGYHRGEIKADSLLAGEVIKNEAKKSIHVKLLYIQGDTPFFLKSGCAMS